jgi:hypothetical protein
MEDRAMDEASPAATGEAALVPPPPRDPPPPPGYVDPLEGSGALEDLAAGDLAGANSEAKTGSSEQQARRD